MPSYSTGISQPANGTSLAPASTWASYSGVLFSVSASTRATILPDMAIPEDELLRRLRAGYDAFNRGDYDATVEWIHPDVVYVSPGGIAEVRGAEALRAWMEPDAFEDQDERGRWRWRSQGNRALIHAAHPGARRRQRDRDGDRVVDGLDLR